jgi:mediator of RNA polymerase II transcription subunit 14
MPGRIVMESNAVPTTNGSKPHPPTMATTAPARLDQVTNGLSNGTTTKQAPSSPPPELEHWNHTYLPMGKLLERMAQQCYNDLSEVIDQMADLNIATPQPNGATSSAPDSSKASVEKKLRLMNFAQTQKDRFIKALVLSDWARNMGDMDKLIELRMWLTQQDDASTITSDGIMQLKHNMINAKMPNPNIKGALELLSTSKAPEQPDLGYLAPKPLSAHKLLRTLRDMNFVLSVRLNLHEQLPPQLCDYSIANGRATFFVPHEFELDLAVTDEDTSTPFYFIDLRFSFSNAPPLGDDFVRSSLEGHLNHILALEGLQAAYNFLHGFVLTHKITLLRKQAFELSRTRWTECLHVEPIHRSLVVQYWTGQPGGKSWIEIGIAKGLDSQKVSDTQDTSAVRLNIRWFRAGKETFDVRFDVDPANPSMEDILNQVTAAHMTLRLSTIRDQLRAKSPPNSALDMSLQVSKTNPNACALSMKLGQYGPATTLRIVPVNGDICISPVTAASTDVERRLNTDPSMDAAQIVSYLNCKLVQDHITRQSVRAGWLLMPTDKQQDVSNMFGEQVIRRTTYTRRGWGEDWAIAATISLSGVKWWIARLTSATTGRSIQSAEALPLPSSSGIFDRQTLMTIESRAVAQVSLSNIAAQLRTAQIHHEIRHVSPSTPNNSASPLSAAVTTAFIGIKFRDLMQPKDPQLRKTWEPWCKETTVLTHHGVDESSREDTKVVHVLKLTLDVKTAEDLACCVGKGTADQGIVFAANGICALQLRTHFGVDLVSSIQSRLRRVERLSTCLRAIKKRNLTVDRVNVSGVVFKYQQTPPLQAGIIFPDSGAAPIQIRLAGLGSSPNPHQSIQPLLQKLLQSTTLRSDRTSGNVLDEASVFEKMLDLLFAALPLLRAFKVIEQHDRSGKSTKVAVRSLMHYLIVYSAPFPAMAFEMQLRRKDGKDIWTIAPSKDRIANGQQLNLALDMLQQAWKGKNVPGVIGFRSGVVAEIDSVETLLRNLDSVVRGIAGPHAGGNDNGHEVVILD